MNISKSYVIPEAIKLKKIRNEDHRHFVVIPRRALLNRSITGENLRVLGVLASYCNKSGYSFVSLKTIANDLNCSIQNIHKHLKRLEKHGIIESFNNYFPLLKGNTRRIIYNEKISHEDLKSDDLSNGDILAIQRHNTLLNSIEVHKADPDKVKQSVNQIDDPLLALFECVTSEADLIQIERLLSSGVDPVTIKDALSSGESVASVIIGLAKRPFSL
jgi:biotin operon repressor